MDTVTGPDLAIALAKSGGLGVIHRNCEVEDAAKMLRAVKEAQISEDCKNAVRDSKGRLAVGVALPHSKTEYAEALAEDADLFFMDVASFYNTEVIEGTRKIIDATGKKVVIGNLGTREGVAYAVKALGKDNIAAVKVGMGGGSICTTTDVTGVGSPVPYAVEQAAQALNKLHLMDKIPIIADGGLRCSRDIALSLCLGASAVMLGNLFARCHESLGDIVTEGGKEYKVYWGMGSAEARTKRFALDRYQRNGTSSCKNINEGIRTLVPVDGTVAELVSKLASELKVTMGYIGAGSIAQMRKVAHMVVHSTSPSPAKAEAR
jgi:IMP dehydrogenase